MSRSIDMANILVVEDKRDAAETLARWLELLGHDVRTARDGHQAIDAARGRRPDVVLLDIGLPGRDGYEVASRLRQILDGPLVIIAITGYGQEEDRRRALAAGCDEHLVKPIDHQALLGLLAAAKTGPPSQLPGRGGRPEPRVGRPVEMA